MTGCSYEILVINCLPSLELSCWWFGKVIIILLIESRGRCCGRCSEMMDVMQSGNRSWITLVLAVTFTFVVLHVDMTAGRLIDVFWNKTSLM